MTINGQQMTITEKEKMEDEIIKVNRTKYHQTKDSCPFMKSPLKQHFGDIGIGTKTQQVLDLYPLVSLRHRQHELKTHHNIG